MNIRDAIVITKETMARNKKQVLIGPDNLTKIKQFRADKKEALKEQKQKILQQLYEKGRKTDKELLEGIRFIESQGEYFRVHDGGSDALYLCSDGTFKVQYWGNYLGDNYIKKLKREEQYYGFDVLLEVLNSDFKALAVEQILKIRKHKKCNAEDAFKEMFEDEG